MQIEQEIRKTVPVLYARSGCEHGVTGGRTHDLTGGKSRPVKNYKKTKPSRLNDE
jgi:hypothetical protein